MVLITDLSECVSVIPQPDVIAVKDSSCDSIVISNAFFATSLITVKLTVKFPYTIVGKGESPHARAQGMRHHQP